MKTAPCHPTPIARRRTRVERSTPHEWVAAALVGVGHGVLDRRAEHAARTGRYVVPATTRLDVLEVYCVHCRVPYSPRLASSPCPESSGRRADHG